MSNSGMASRLDHEPQTRAGSEPTTFCAPAPELSSSFIEIVPGSVNGPIATVAGLWQYEGAGALHSNSGMYKWNKTVIEGLDLRAVAAGDYELVCLPLKIISETGDGAPARTILRTL